MPGITYHQTDNEPQPGDILLFNTKRYQCEGIAYLINQFSKILSHSDITHTSMFLLNQLTDHGDMSIIGDSMPGGGPQITPLDDNARGGSEGDVLRFTPDDKDFGAKVRRIAAIIFYAHTRLGDGREEKHSLIQALRTVAPNWLSFFKPEGIFKESKNPDFINRFEGRLLPGHGQRNSLLDGTFCLKIVLQSLECAYKYCGGEGDLFPFNTDTICPGDLYHQLAQTSNDPQRRFTCVAKFSGPEKNLFSEKELQHHTKEAIEKLERKFQIEVNDEDYENQLQAYESSIANSDNGWKIGSLGKISLTPSLFG